MTSRRRIAAAMLGAVGFFLAVQIGALWLQEPFTVAEYQAVEDPTDPANSILYIGVLLVATVGMLLLMKYDLTRVLRAFIVLTSGLISAYVFSIFVPPIVGEPGTLHLGALLGGAVIVLGLALYPEWWVIDAAGLVMGMGAAALFGISLDVLPVLLLLTVLAVYDAISVYGTEHMLTLASGVMELRVPVLIILPTTRSFSFREMAADLDTAEETTDPGESETGDPADMGSADAVDTGSADAAGAGSADAADAGSADPADAGGSATEDPDNPLDRDAFFIGLGDVVIPTILVVSAATFLEMPTVLGLEYAALGAMIGTLLGLLALLYFVTKGRPHAGLPLLNGGAILGYLLGAVAGGLTLVEALGLGPFLV
ncbi:MAG: presenilin family intramembrane aspartyl protease PSH [Halodesulfurarchaeum sp.]|nr:presenilin family intramembrane aspartyl protease PSH [Halodesulfurarchaeum sp.]